MGVGDRTRSSRSQTQVPGPVLRLHRWGSIPASYSRTSWGREELAHPLSYSLAPSIMNQIFDLPQKIGDVGSHKRLWSGTLWGSYLVIDGDCLCRWWTGTCVEEVTGQGDPAGVGCKELACSQGWDPELLGGR